MGRHDIYTVKDVTLPVPNTGPVAPSTVSLTQTFEVVKCDEDHNYIESYHVVDLGGHNGYMVCNCFAGSKSTCRHRTMLRLFQAEERIGKGWFYHFDKKTWLEPLNTEGQS